MVLISGPTGSGKTTTLYATLKQLNKLQTNILTIEDPIEYTLEGINQVALKERIGLDFPNAFSELSYLISLLSQDFYQRILFVSFDKTFFFLQYS